MSSADIEQCYRVLELTPGASQADIKKAYRDLAMVWHPDRFSGNARLQQKATRRLQQINEAYSTLQSASAPEQARARQQARRRAKHRASSRHARAERVYRQAASGAGPQTAARSNASRQASRGTARRAEKRTAEGTPWLLKRGLLGLIVVGALVGVIFSVIGHVAVVLGVVMGSLVATLVAFFYSARGDRRILIEGGLYWGWSSVFISFGAAALLAGWPADAALLQVWGFLFCLVFVPMMLWLVTNRDRHDLQRLALRIIGGVAQVVFVFLSVLVLVFAGAHAVGVDTTPYLRQMVGW